MREPGEEKSTAALKQLRGNAEGAYLLSAASNGREHSWVGATERNRCSIPEGLLENRAVPTWSGFWTGS